MIFQLKDPIQEKVKKEENLWKKKFAWFPVKTKNNQLVWLEDVYTIKEEKQIIVNKNVYVTNVQFFMQKHAGIISLNGIEKINKIEETDGLITKDSGVILTVITGDCCPLIFVDKKLGIIGIAHLGWRGSMKRMAQKMIDQMVSAGADVNFIKVALGPSIGECCYDVDDDRYYEFVEEFDGYSEKIFHRRHGKLHLNLTLLNYLLLLEKGIKKENIDYFPFCTKCDKNRFFSFRRDKKQDYGEMLSFIMMPLVNN